MEAFLLPEWAPNIHPLLVHFPIALLVMAVLANLLTFFLPKNWWDETKNTAVYLTGVLSAGVTYYTGTIAVDTVFLPAEAQSVLTEHAGWAKYLLWFFILYVVLRIAFHWFDLFEKKAFKIIAFITVLPGLFMVYETAEYGGKMVFGYGAGTGQLLEQEKRGSTLSSDSASTVSSSFIEQESGNWSWQITSNAVSDLIANFHWVEGSVQELKPTVTSTEPVRLKLEAQEQPNVFVTHNSYQNIQVDYYLNLNNFEGEVELVHHFQDAENYDFVSLNEDGVIRQGRVENGNRTLFEEGTFELEGELFVRVVGDGTHFRGYVDKEMKVHGHGDAPESGSVGIKLTGSGFILISKIEMTQL